MIFMDKKDRGSISIMKIIGVSLIFILIFGVSVIATEIDIKSVEVTMSNGYTMTLVTTKTNVAEILADNNIIIEDDERVTPSLDSEIKDNNKITITNPTIWKIFATRLKLPLVFILNVVYIWGIYWTNVIADAAIPHTFANVWETFEQLSFTVTRIQIIVTQNITKKMKKIYSAITNLKCFECLSS